MYTQFYFIIRCLTKSCVLLLTFSPQIKWRCHQPKLVIAAPHLVRINSNAMSIYDLICYLLVHFISQPIHTHNQMAISEAWFSGCRLSLALPLCVLIQTLLISWHLHTQYNNTVWRSHYFIPNKILFSSFETAFLIPSALFAKCNKTSFFLHHLKKKNVFPHKAILQLCGLRW